MFDLENAIREWKKSLFKEPGIEESDVIELEEGLRDEIEELCQEGLSEEEAFRRVTAEMAPSDVLGSEFYKVRTTRRSGRPSWKAPRFMPELLWSYLKVALRKINRQKSYSFINIAGLSVAMACFLLILSFIQFELSFDRFFENSDRIFRVSLREDSPEEESYSLSTPEILSKSLKTSIPEIEKTGIIQRSHDALVQAGDKHFTEDGLFADAGFFGLFSFDLVIGDRASVLGAPNSIVLSDSLAEKLFNDANPVGQSIRFKGRYLNHDLVVTGVVKHPPKNSHLQFDYLISTATMAADEELKDWFNDWDTYAFNTYVQLHQKQARHQVESKIQALIKEARPGINLKEDVVSLQPVTDIHLKSRVAGATATNDQIQTVYLFGSIALIILLVAGINSMNLSTALATTRNKEVSMRKVTGAQRIDLIKQFMGESYILTTLAMVLSILMFYAFFPVFSDFVGINLTVNEVEIIPLVLSIMGTIIFVGAFSGLYPSLVLSSFQPFSIGKKLSTAWLRGSRVRNLLVVLQFSAVILLIIGTLVITRQLNFIRHTNLGFNREHVVILPFREEEAISKVAALKTALEGFNKIQSVTISDSTPLKISTSLGGLKIQKENGEDIKINMYMANVDYEFLDVYDIRLAEGRNFSPDFPTDSQAVLVNQALVRKAGWQNPLGREIINSTIIGVFEDFHFDTLHKPIEPALFVCRPDFYPFGGVNIGIRFRPDNFEGTLAQIKNTFTQLISSQPYDFYFLDDAYDQLYRREKRLAVMIGYLEGLAILLGCMGLLGLAAYSTQRRSKEIGIRKVLGASVASLVRMMSREYLILVGISNVIAWPLGYYLLHRWLQAYAYRCSYGIEIFILAGLAALLIAAVAVSLYTVRASLASPVKSIRYE
ncbi:MAG TPA: FtsX-like permease family protein [Desulfobacteraceae bacterium]|nr:FtsX-like permease family protein [Desulfobacteraceae bacterium]